MKKLMLSGVLVLVLALGIGAQPLFKSGLTGKGFKVGIGMAKFTGSDLGSLEDFLGLETKHLTRLTGGAFLTFSLSPMFAIQPEAMITTKGAKWSEGGASLSEKLTYLQIPILAKVMFQTPGVVKPSIYAGPTLGFLLSAKESLEGTGQYDAEGDVKDLYQSNDIGLILGFGVDVGAGGGAVTFDGRYELGLSKIMKGGGGITPDIKNSQVRFLVGYSF